MFARKEVQCKEIYIPIKKRMAESNLTDRSNLTFNTDQKLDAKKIQVNMD